MNTKTHQNPAPFTHTQNALLLGKLFRLVFSSLELVGKSFFGQNILLDLKKNSKMEIFELESKTKIY